MDKPYIQKSLEKNRKGSEAYQFIKQKLKALNKTQEQLALELSIDRITLYRRLNNQIAMTEDLNNSLFKALKLTPDEAEKLNRLIHISKFTDDTIKLWKNVDDVVFDLTATNIPQIYFKFFANEIWDLSGEMLFDRIFSDYENPDFAYEITVVNCLDLPAAAKLAPLLEYVKLLKGKAVIRHLVDFYQNDFEKSMNTISTLVFRLPLIQIENYYVYYRQTYGEGKKPLFDNCVLCTVTNSKKVKSNYWMVLAEPGDSSCITFTDEIWSSFIKLHFEDYLREFKELLFQTNIDENVMGEIYRIQKEESGAVLMIKSDPCYDMIPPDVYKSWKNRCYSLLDTTGILFFSNSIPDQDLENAIDFFIDFERQRYELSLDKTRIDIYSANGLHKFARTGRLSDHVKGLPPLSKQEVLRILQNLYDRSINPSDPFQLYITRRDLFLSKYDIMVSKGGNIYIELLDDDSDKYFQRVTMKQQAFGDHFFQYVENWLIPTYAMPPKDSGRFMMKLIEEIQQSVNEL